MGKKAGEEFPLLDPRLVSEFLILAIFMGSCRALMSTRDPNYPPNTAFPYFFSFTVPQPKTRIKIPKMLGKTMQKSISGSSDIHDRNKDKKKWNKPKKLIPKMFGSLLTSVFGNKNSNKAHSKAIRNDGQHGVVAPQRPLSKSCSWKKLLGFEDDESEQKIGPNKEKRENKPTMEDKHPKFLLPFSSFFHKHASFKFIRSKIIKTNANDSLNNGTMGNTVVGAADGIVIRRQGQTRNTLRTLPSDANFDTLIGGQDRCSDLPRVPSRVLTARRKLKMARSLRKVANRQPAGKSVQDGGEKMEERRGEELCRKRILMGEKCKPLNYSGILQYDNDGILLPEFF